MLRLLTTISWRHVRRHRLRTALTFLGMALGVAVIVAIALVNRSLTTSFQSTIEQIAGKAVLQVSNSESGFAESIFPTIRDTAGVKDVAAAVDGFLPVSGRRSERLYVYGVDLFTDFAMRDHRFAGDGFAFDKALDFIASPDSIALTESFARRHGLTTGSAITLNTSRGKQSYRVRALLKEEGTARVFGGNFALMDLPVAKALSGRKASSTSSILPWSRERKSNGCKSVCASGSVAWRMSSGRENAANKSSRCSLRFASGYSSSV